MRYRLIQAEKTVYPVKVLCRILGVARSGFYARELCSKGHPFLTRQEARTAIFKYVEGFNKRARRHSMLGYLSPVEFEQRAAYSTTGVR
jgi:transposase InsO family protein